MPLFQSRQALAVLIGLYLMLCGLVLGVWWLNGQYYVTGDEPHYLVMADGLVSFGSFEQRAPYNKEFRKGNILPGLSGSYLSHVVEGPNGLYNIHNIGLPILIAVPYAVGTAFGEALMDSQGPNSLGVVFTKIFLITLSTGIVIGAWRAAGLTGASVVQRFVGVVAVVFAYPFIPGAGQIYPEFIAGIILLFSVLHVMQRENEKGKASFFRLILLGFTLSILPWLQIKFAAPALIAVLSLGMIEWNRGGRFIPAFVVLGLLGSSILLLSYYNMHAYGNWAGPYHDDALQVSPHSLMVFLGLHLDRFHGFLFQNVSYWLVPFFFGSLLKTYPISITSAMMVFLSIVVSNALHPTWYGGASFAGRFQWAAVIAMVPVVVAAVMNFQRRFPSAARVFLLVCIFYSMVSYVRYGFGDLGLYNPDPRIWADMYPSFVPVLGAFLPVFFDSSWAFSHLQNYAWVLFVWGVIIAGGIFTYSRSHVVTGIVVSSSVSVLLILLLVGVFAMPGPPQDPLVFTGKELGHQVGAEVNGIWLVENSENPGFLSYGPSIQLPQGEYRAVVNYWSNLDAKTHAGWIDVSYDRGNLELAKRPAWGMDGRQGCIRVPFALENAATDVEVRFWWEGKGSVGLESIVIDKEVEGRKHVPREQCR